jgi:hypothetical protein
MISTWSFSIAKLAIVPWLETLPAIQESLLIINKLLVPWVDLLFGGFL